MTKNIPLVITSVYLVIIIVSAFKLLKLNIANLEKSKNLETQILETQLKLKEQELKYLKMQIHPHFLFNTLNTIYGFALKKTDETPKMILKLSNLLDYLLYQIDKPFVSLNQEINHIEDYLALEQLRFNETLDISLTCKGVNNTIKITPMLMLPFVENSFKHGTIINGKLKVEISVIYKSDILFFVIKNTSKKALNKRKGIGLENIKRRLNFLYKEHYTLNILEKDNTFEVHLKLNTKLFLQND